MVCKSVVFSTLASLLLSLSVLASDSECSYNVSRNFSNILSVINRGDVVTSDVAELLFKTEESLVRIDPKTNIIQSSLASSWEFDPANQRFLFTLNKSCHWSDGSPLIADDIVFGFQELYSHGVMPHVGGNLIAGSEAVVGGAAQSALQVKALADDKISVGVNGAPDIALMYLAYVSFSPLPSHVADTEYLPFSSPERLTIGPFKVSSATTESIVLERNPYYCSDQKVDVDRIEIFNRKQGYWELADLMEGQLDMMRYPPEKQVQHIQKTASEDSIARVEVIDENRQTYLIINPLNEGLANAEIRRKLFEAIDLSSLTVRGNTAAEVRKVAKTLFHDLPNYENYEYSKQTDSYTEGIEALRISMEKYGYGNEKRLKASIITYPLERFETSAKMLASMLRQAHFDIIFVQSKSVDEVIKAGHTGRFDMYFNSWTLDYLDPQSSLDGLLQAVGYLLKGDELGAELTDTFVRPLTDLLDKLARSRDQAERFKNLQSIEKLLLDSGLIIPIYTEHSAILVSSRVAPLNGHLPRSWILNLTDCGVPK